MTSQAQNPPAFADLLLLEQVRLLEESGVINTSAGTAEQDDGHAQTAGTHRVGRLINRARRLVREQELTALIRQPQQRCKQLLTGVSIVCAIAAILAVSNAMATTGGSEQRVNIYWLLLLLLGFNLLSMGLWLAGIASRASGLMQGLAGQLPAVALRHLPQGRLPAATAWLQVNCSGPVGIWRISRWNHGLWLVYLLSGSVTLLLFLAARQYDFYWGSTLLSRDSFQLLTDWLSRPLGWLGMHIDGQLLIESSRIGNLVDNAANDLIRQQWARFLLGSLLLYGLLPRLALWLLSGWQLRLAQARYTPDFYLPYYINLQHQLEPLSTPSTIVDPDLLPNPSTFSSASPDRFLVDDTSAQTAAREWPANALLAGIELPEELARQLPLNIHNKASLEAALTAVADTRDTAVVVVVSTTSLPDRGVQRQIVALQKNRKPEQRWLLLIAPDDIHQQPREQTRQRLHDWYNSAKFMEIPATHIQKIEARQFSQNPVATAVTAPYSRG